MKQVNANLIKRLLDACFLAKRVAQTLPPLPDGLVPRHVHVMDSIHQLSEEKDTVYVGDVSALMKSTTPSVTKLIGELDRLGYVTKQSVPGDKRFVAISLSKKGEQFHARHVVAYHKILAGALSDLNPDDCLAAIRVMTTLHDRIPEISDRRDPKSERNASK